MAPTSLVPAAALEAAPVITPEQLALIKQTIAKDATPVELQLFLYDNARRGIHPLDKLLHFAKRGGKYTPITSIDFMRSRAAQTQDYAGQEDAIFVGMPKAADFAARVTVYRLVHEQRCAFTATARWSEYKPDQDFMWQKMPHTMLGKCAEALALRKAFPQELAGLYEAAELEQAEQARSVDRQTGEIVEGQTGEIADEGTRLITDAQRKRLFALAKKNGWSTEAVKATLRARFRFDSTKVIPFDQYDTVCEAFGAPPPAPLPIDPGDQPF
jgi:phage recombination protein Bet